MDNAIWSEAQPSVAQNIGNFINIALTLATRHQYATSSKMMSQKLGQVQSMYSVQDFMHQLAMHLAMLYAGDLVATRDRPLELTTVDTCYKSVLSLHYVTW